MNHYDAAEAMLREITRLLRELADSPQAAELTGPEALTIAARALDAWIPEIKHVGAVLLVEGEDSAQAFAAREDMQQRVRSRMGLK